MTPPAPTNKDEPTEAQKARIKLQSDVASRISVNFLTYAAITPAGAILLTDTVPWTALLIVSGLFAFASLILYIVSNKILERLDRW
ncbi:MAG: hypothetical protein AAFW98_11915 [Pseudomonadota bacterium]